MIIDAQLKERYYKALRECDANFDGVFFAAIKQLVFFAMRLVVLGSLNLTIVSFTKQLKQPF